MVARVHRMHDIHAFSLDVVHTLYGASFPASTVIISHYIDIPAPTHPNHPIGQDVCNGVSAHALQ